MLEAKGRLLLTSERGRSSTMTLLLVGITLLVRVPGWRMSVINGDESIFALAGREVLWGHLPCITLFDVKPVGSSLMIAAAMAVMGKTVLAVRILGAACVAVSAILIERLTRMITNAHSGASLAAALIYIGYTTCLDGLASMLELLLAPFTCGAVALLVSSVDTRETRSQVYLAAGAGTLFGVAVWIKIVPVLSGGALFGSLLAYWLCTSRISWSMALLCASFFAILCIVPMVGDVPKLVEIGGRRCPP